MPSGSRSVRRGASGCLGRRQRQRQSPVGGGRGSPAAQPLWPHRLQPPDRPHGAATAACPGQPCSALCPLSFALCPPPFVLTPPPSPAGDIAYPLPLYLLGLVRGPGTFVSSGPGARSLGLRRLPCLRTPTSHTRPCRPRAGPTVARGPTLSSISRAASKPSPRAGPHGPLDVCAGRQRLPPPSLTSCATAAAWVAAWACR